MNEYPPANGHNQPVPPFYTNPPQPAPYPAAPPTPGKPPRQYAAPERALVFVALAVAILYDRLLLANMGRAFRHLPFFSAIFWLVFLVVLYLFYWKRLRANKILWLVGGLTASLCSWNLFFDYQSSYGSLTCLVIPAVLMGHCQFLAGGHKLGDVAAMALSWLAGWVVKPFSAIPALFGASRSMLAKGKNATAKKVFIGVGIAIPLLLIILPLLSSADMVFGYYLDEIFYGFQMSSFVGHLLLVAVGTLLFYSFLWNIGFAEPRQKSPAKRGRQIDGIISGIVLGAVLAVYLFFCTVQFTYLFAGTGLPGDMTYSEYAREGFAQIIVICGLNLVIFGIFLQYGKKRRVLAVLLGGLLALTAVMLASGFVRLGLYIENYGLTWLRLLSFWFMVYMAVVLILCAVRMARERIALIAVCAIVLLAWYAALGYVNPDALILRYNLNNSKNAEAWLEDNNNYVSYLSDDAMLVLLEQDLSPQAMQTIIDSRRNAVPGYSLASHRLAKRLEE